MAKDRSSGAKTVAGLKGLRLDRWLWVARFFRTRERAKQAVLGGKVEYTGAKAKPSSEVRAGVVLKVRQGEAVREVVIKQLASRRQSAPLAALLYEETEDSIKAAKVLAETRKMQVQPRHYPGKPSKKERRVLTKFKESWRAS